MGRNLDALLGGASRERASSVQPDNSASLLVANTDKASLDSVPEPTDFSEKLLHASSTGNSATDPLTSPAPAIGADQVTEVVETSTPAASVSQAASTLQIVESRAIANAKDSTDTLKMIGVDQIRRGTYQPRRLFDPVLLQELADSIKTQGMIQPILVRSFAGAFELIAGERRWRAAQLAGLIEVPAIIREMPDQSVAAVALIENIQRKDLNPLEEAAAFERLCDEFGMTHKTVAESVGRSRASVSNLLRLLELHEDVKVLVDKGELEMGHARAILGAPKDQQYKIAQQVVDRGLTVRAVEKIVRELNEGPVPKTSNNKGHVVDPDIERLSQKLGETLGASVRIQHKATGAGTLEVTYSSVSELQGILAHIK
ncbi:MAG: ParB family chromosome partitioning protein [Pseudomonadales bacterium]|jgi:ParB family chromosome partitioning protein